MLRAVKVPSTVQTYIESFYSQLQLSAGAGPVPFQRGVFQGDTMSPIVFVLTFNPLLKLSAHLKQGHGYNFELPLQNSEALPSINTSVYVKWMEDIDEPPGWYRARVSEYFQDTLVQLHMMTLQNPPYLKLLLNGYLVSEGENNLFILSPPLYPQNLSKSH